MGRTVLLVEVGSHVTGALERSLRKEPYEILSAESADEGLSILARRSVDVVISDENMAGMSGSQFLAVVCGKYPETVRIILTAQASLNAAVRAVNEGQIYRFLLKPCNEVDLAVTIRQALRQKQLMAQNRELLKTITEQSRLLQDLEREYPGIAHVKRSPSGTVIIDEADCDPEMVVDRIGGDAGDQQGLPRDADQE